MSVAGDEREIRTSSVLLVLLGGYAAGLLILFADLPWWSDANRKFAHEGPFLLWSSLMCAQTALWALVLAWIVPSVLRLRRAYGEENRGEVIDSTIVIGALILVVIVVPPLTSPVPDYVPNHIAKVSLLTLLGSVVGLIAARGIWFVHGGLKRLGRVAKPTGETMRTLQSLEGELHRFLGTLGAILGLLILSSGAQRRAVLAFRPSANYPYENVLVYGLFFSILIAAVYLPTFVTLTAVANRICDSFFPEVSPLSPDWEERTAKRDKLRALLPLQAGPFSRFKASAAILTPLVGSLTGLLLNAK
jgi:hypothetical protein